MLQYQQQCSNISNSDDNGIQWFVIVATGDRSIVNDGDPLAMFLVAIVENGEF